MLTFKGFIRENWNEYLHPREPAGGEGGGRFSNKYIHYSDQKLSSLRKDQQQLVGSKPKGLWVSIGSEWDEWCRENDFRQDELQTKTAVVIKKHAKILRIHNAEQLDKFHEKYNSYNCAFKTGRYGEHESKFGEGIDWAKVTEKYQGIIIAPYIWSRRMKYMWYYGWDVASGCIWDVDAVKELK